MRLLAALILMIVVLGQTVLVAAPGISNSDIKTNAAIARSKLASGTANGVVVNNGSGVMTDLPTGATGQVLTMVAGAAAWQTPTATSPTFNMLTKTASYSLGATDDYIVYTGTANATFTAPACSGVSGHVYHIKNYSYYTLTIVSGASDTFDGDSSVVLSDYKTAVELACYGGSIYYVH